MTVIRLTFTVPNIQAVIDSYDRIKVYRSVTGVAGPFLEISVEGTRPVLEPNLVQYEFVDSFGDTDYFYTNSFFDSSLAVPESAQSDPPSQGVSDPALDILSVQMLKSIWLFGVPLKDEAGNPMPDLAYEHYIRAAVGWVSRMLDLPIIPVVYTEDVPLKLDFIRQDYYKYIRLKVHEYPILSVESIKLVLPTNVEVISFDPTWWQIQDFSGQLEILPGSGSIAVITLGQTGAWLPLIYGWTDFIPMVFRVAYTAGFPKGKVPPEIIDLIGKVAAIGPLNIIGDIVGLGPGITGKTLNTDGLMSRVDASGRGRYSGYSARILAYWSEINATVIRLRQYYRGIPLVVA